MASTTTHAPTARTYLLVFAALLTLTASTVLVAYAELGPWHTAVALAIAFAKATLIVLFFMHALGGSRLVHLIVLAALLWLGIMLAFTLADFWTREADKRIRNPASLSAPRQARHFLL